MQSKRLLGLGLALIVLMALQSVPVSAKEGEPAKSGVQHYLIVSPHTTEECLSALDDVAAKGKDELAKWDWGCADGDHTGYCIVDASSKEAALAMVPQKERAKAKAILINKFSIEQIRAIHEAHKGH